MADTHIPFLLIPRKPETPNFRGVGNSKFCCTTHIYEMATIYFYFFIMADTDIPFLLTLGKPETQTWVGNLKVFHTMHIYEMMAIF